MNSRKHETDQPDGIRNLDDKRERAEMLLELEKRIDRTQEVLIRLIKSLHE